MTSIDSKNLFYRTNSEGLIELIDSMTGEIIAVQKTAHDDFIQNRLTNFVEVVHNGKTIWLDSGISEYTPKPTAKLSQALADIICEKLLQGSTLNQICKLPGFPPYHTVKKWELTNQDFAAAVDLARRTRADIIADRIQEAGESMLAGSMSKSELESTRAGADVLKWVAERANPNRYGAQKQQVDTAVQIVINTGISREPAIIEVKHDSEAKDDKGGV